jgi:hypothetical protein
MIQADFGHQPLQALTPLGTGARPPQVIVDHQHAGRGPPPGDRPSHEAIVQAGGFLMRQSIGARTRRPTAPSAVGGFSRCTTVPPQCRGADSSLSSPKRSGAQLVLQQLPEQPQEALAIWDRQPHPQLDEFAGPYGRGGGQGSTYTPFLFYGLKPELGHNGTEIQQSAQANNRI